MRTKRTKTAAAKVVSKTKARTSVKSATTSSRPDGLRPDSKLALLLDEALALTKKNGSATEEELCKKLGWVKCAVTLRRVCDRVGASCDRKDGHFVVKMKKTA